MIADTSQLSLHRSPDDPSKVEVDHSWKTALGVIPAGFDTDGATIPWWLWWLIGHPLTPAFWGAATIHDWLYSTKQIPRAQADAALRDKLQEDGAGWLRSRAMWTAVRVFGWLYW